ncbi:MAG: hypothetical protein RLZZ618_1005 [Pseudomonadota bacterium]|jgi:putative transposase
MARLPRLSVGGWPHLVVLSGHDGQAVFRDDEDARHFSVWLLEAVRAQGVAVHAYALRENEVVLLATPDDSAALGRVMQTLGRRYGGYFNRRHGRRGSLWAGRFRATIVEPEQHLLDAMRYVEESDAEQTAQVLLTSMSHHLGQRQDPLVSDHAQFWSLGNTPFDREAAYRRLLERPLSAAGRGSLDQAVQKGWPVGSKAFVQQLGDATERRLVPLKRGRPPIKAAAGN